MVVDIDCTSELEEKVEEKEEEEEKEEKEEEEEEERVQTFFTLRQGQRRVTFLLHDLGGGHSLG